jgi:hypothetical protein
VIESNLRYLVQNFGRSSVSRMLFRESGFRYEKSNVR